MLSRNPSRYQSWQQDCGRAFTCTSPPQLENHGFNNGNSIYNKVGHQGSHRKSKKAYLIWLGGFLAFSFKSSYIWQIVNLILSSFLGIILFPYLFRTVDVIRPVQVWASNGFPTCPITMTSAPVQIPDHSIRISADRGGTFCDVHAWGRTVLIHLSDATAHYQTHSSYPDPQNLKERKELVVKLCDYEYQVKMDCEIYLNFFL